ncbi:MAG: ABC transporter ATP-binding protein, partial [Chloroflexi bacterium]|nr:ABC transporter ATP-binding protein [Chloroflexota bacterium]
MTNAQKTNSSTDLSVPALSASELIFSYSKRRIVLQNIDLVIRGGERVGLIGPNGAG